MKAWLESRAVVGGLVTAVLSVGVAISPVVSRIICRSAGQGGVACANSQDVVDVIVSLAGFAGAGGGLAVVGGRLAQGDVYTPHGLPGPDREEVLERWLEEVADGHLKVPPPPEVPEGWFHRGSFDGG